MTAAGIALGVSAAVAVGVVRDSLSGAFVSLVEAMAGDATLQIGGDGVPVPDALLEQVRAIPGVRRAAPSIMTTARLVGKPDAAFLIAAIDVLDEPTLGQYKTGDSDIDPVVFLNSKQSLLVSESLAARDGIKVGDDLKALTAGGVQVFKVRGLLADKGPARIFGGNFALMYLDAAQALFDRDGTYDRIDLVTTEPVAPVLEAVRQVVGDRARVERPERRGARMEQFLSSLDVGMMVLSLVAVFIGMFLVYNTVSTSVAERRRDIGILRAMGLLRWQVVTLFALEAGLLGALAGIIGVPVGVGLGRLAMGVMQHQVELVVPLALDRVFTTPSRLFLAWALGVIAAALAALPPALAASRVRPRDAIEHGDVEAQTQSHPYAFAIAASVLLGLSALCYTPFFRSKEAAVYAGEMAIVLGLVGMTPLLSLLLARAFTPLGRLSVHARLAVDHLQRAKQITTVTVSALAVGVCLAATSATVTRSFKISAERVLGDLLPADFFIHGGARMIGTQSSLIREALLEKTKTIAGVAAATGVRILPTFLFRDEPIALIAVEAKTHLTQIHPVLRAGTMAEAVPIVMNGDGFFVSENFCSHFGVKYGDSIALDSPTGPVRGRIAAVYLDYLSLTGTVVMDREVYRRRFSDPLIDSIDVFVQKTANRAAVRASVAASFADDEQLLIMNNGEVRGDMMKLIDETFLLVYAQEVVAILVAVLGILHALSVSVLERTRELAVLRAQGLTQNELIRVVLIEAALIGVMGSLIGALFGAALAHQNVTVLIAQQTGWTFDYSFAWLGVLQVGGLCVLAALCAGFFPARRAAALPVSEALRFE